MIGSEHPGMIKPGMVDVSEFELINGRVHYHVSDELEHHGLTIDQVLNKYPNVTKFKVKNWIEGSVGDVDDKPRHIHFIDDDGNGFTLLDFCCVSKINDYVNCNEGRYVSFLG